MSARRTWDKEHFEKKAQDRLQHGDEYVDGAQAVSRAQKQADMVREEFRPADSGAAGPLGSERAFLKGRESKVELEDRVGKVEIINPTDPNSAKAGFWCEVCKCLLKDSAGYLDHINGKKHQRALGFSMRVERADVSSVKDRLAELKRKMHTSPAPHPSALEEFDQRMAAQEAEKEDFKRRRKEEVRAKKAAKDGRARDEESDQEEGGNSDVAALMGFKGFGSSKR